MNLPSRSSNLPVRLSLYVHKNTFYLLVKEPSFLFQSVFLLMDKNYLLHCLLPSRRI